MAKIIIEFKDDGKLVGVSCTVEHGGTDFVNQVADVFAAAIKPDCQEKIGKAIEDVSRRSKTHYQH